VGFGSGVTVGTALEFPVGNVDTIELENAVIEASRVFGALEGEKVDPEFNVNHLIYRKPYDLDKDQLNPKFDWSDPNTYIINDRLNIFSNDGRNFLASSTKQYDVIISEPSNPWITGVANMFTKDNFESAVGALKPDGIFCQWVQLYELSPKNIKTIFRTFASVFPHVALFTAEDLSSDTMLLGSFEPISFDLGHVRKVMDNPKVRAEMERAYVFSATDVFARVLLVDRKELFDYTNGPGGEETKDLPINTDDNAVIEFSAPRDLISYSSFAGYLATIYTSKWSYGDLLSVIDNFGKETERAHNFSEQAVSLLSNGRKEESKKFQKEAESLAPDDPSVTTASKMVTLLEGEGGDPIPLFEDVEASATMTEIQVFELKIKVEDVMKSLDAGAVKDALERFGRIPEHLWQQGGPQMMLLKGYLHFLNADPEDQTMCDESVEVLTQLVREYEAYAEAHPEIYFYLALCHDNCLHFDKAVKSIRTYVSSLEKSKERDLLALAQAEANLEAALKGIEGTMPIELPPEPPGSPTTDRQGESKKDLHLP
jgi:hypothetical protein